MLKQAVEAGLPLIAVTTRDTINARDVIARILARPVNIADPVKGGQPAKNAVNVVITTPGAKPSAINFAPLYEAYQKAEASLIVVNPPYPDPALFDAGDLMIPHTMKAGLLTKAGVPTKLVQTLTRALGNVTLKETNELLRLTLIRDGGISQKGLVRSRRDFFQGQSGLTQVLSDEGFYDPPAFLHEYVESERRFFLKNDDHRLIPRGLLFDGPPGVGKTAGAKYVADAWGIPLFRFDLGSTQGKWVGDSEGNMVRNLARLDREEPCAVLFDEIEKVFSGHDDESGTISRMKASLLWWLAEHRSRVFAIMTTNNKEALPPELYRERRIDKVMLFQGLQGPDETRVFVEHALRTFDVEVPDPENAEALAAYETAVSDIVKSLITGHLFVPQARVYERVIREIKAMHAALDADG